MNEAESVKSKKQSAISIANSYRERASILNNAKPGYRSHISRASSVFSKERLGDKYPKLLKELNDPNAAVPAYIRFQRQDSCILREDLRILKEQHFRKNYQRQLESCKKSLDEVAFRGTKLNADNYYSLKYFMNEDL